MADVITIEAGQGNKRSDKINGSWWAEDDKDIYHHVFGVVNTLETKQSYRTQENIKNARLYSDLEILGVYAGLYSPQVKESVLSNRLSLNVIKSCVDTITSRIAKTKPRPMFLTEGGDWPMRQKAKQLTKFMDGQFDVMKHYEVKQDTFRDSCIFGTGATKFYIDWDNEAICSERILIEEILVDDAQAIYGKPPVLYQRRLVSKDALMRAFPKHKALIEGASSGLNGSAQYSPGLQDMVKVIEAWKPASTKDSNDGAHVMCIDTVTLQCNKKYQHTSFPFTFERWNKPILGFYGVGIARELTGIQIEINKILRDIQRSMHLFAVPRVFVENSSQINLAAINNDIGAIIKHTGSTAPQFYTPQAMSPDVYAHLWRLMDKAYEITGVSQLAANAQKPSGLDSAVALREYSDIESERFQIVAQRREEMFLDDARIIVYMAKELSEKVKGYKVRVADKGSMSVIKWKDVNLDDDKYMLRVFPASILPTQPAAKIQKIVEYTQAGFFDKDTAMDLMDFPDIEAATNLQLSPRRVVLKMLDAMVESNEYQPPEPFMNLQMSQQLAQYYYLAAKNEGVPEDKLELIRRFIDQVVSLQMAQMPPAPMPGMPMDPAAAPMPGQDPAMAAAPEPVPTNPMLPQA